ncbi:MAG: hypothetical protein H6779_05085 [Candidatus Nomurabacteria bacterium]|nr:hypothetical protein [Candidatus Nomurabacteria bacterium]USN87742.1 MAG: hypothetical protein H6779_05085 [Candidatus Nomurabacteria bacterium]
MKIYVSHSNQLDYENDLYIPIRQSRLNSEHKFVLPHEGGQNINSKEEIKSSDLFIAEVSFPSTGSGIEIGWAESFGIPLLFIYKKGNKVPGSLKFLSGEFLEYENSDDFIEKITNYLENIS